MLFLSRAPSGFASPARERLAAPKSCPFSDPATRDDHIVQLLRSLHCYTTDFRLVWKPVKPFYFARPQERSRFCPRNKKKSSKKTSASLNFMGVFALPSRNLPEQGRRSSPFSGPRLTAVFDLSRRSQSASSGFSTLDGDDREPRPKGRTATTSLGRPAALLNFSKNPTILPKNAHSRILHTI